jgi:hypothetical protein
MFCVVTVGLDRCAGIMFMSMLSTGTRNNEISTTILNILNHIVLLKGTLELILSIFETSCFFLLLRDIMG